MDKNIFAFGAWGKDNKKKAHPGYQPKKSLHSILASDGFVPKGTKSKQFPTQ
jgi:hypothetical protein